MAKSRAKARSPFIYAPVFYFLETFPNFNCVERKNGKNGILGMDQALNKALHQSDVDDTLLSAVEHADLTMRKYIWRRFMPKSSSLSTELIVDDKSANDFVNEALQRLCAGKRTYDSARTLLENLNSVTDSLIWSDKKASDRTGVIDFAPSPEGADMQRDVIESQPEQGGTAAELLSDKEQCAAQTKCFDMIRASFDGDKEMQEYLDTLSQGFYKPDEISELTGISVQKIYETRRKLKKYTNRLFGVTNFSELKFKLDLSQNESEPKSAC